MKLIVTPQAGDAYELWTVPVRADPVLEGERLIGYDLEFRAGTLWTARTVVPAGAPAPLLCELSATSAGDLVRWRWADASGIVLDLAARAPRMVELEVRVEKPSGQYQRGPRKPRPAPP